MSKAGNALESPIFIVGYIHTGTTLLQNILLREPDLLIAKGETHFFEDLRRIRTEYPDLRDEAVRHDYVLYLVKLAHLGYQRTIWYSADYSLADLDVSDEQFAAIVRAVDDSMAAAPPGNEHAYVFGVVMDQLALQAGRNRWLEKTPQHVFFLKEVFKTWPDAKIIDLVRDPRAALASRKIRRSEEYMEKKIAADPLATDRSTNFDPLIDSYVWKEAVSTAAEAKKIYGDRILTVRYEDLVISPEATIRGICEFTGLEFQPEMLQVGWVNTTSRTSENASEGISTAALEKWKRTLTPEEVFICQQVLAEQMRQLDYAPMAVGLTAKAKSPVLLGQSAVRLAGRLRNKRPEGIEHRRIETTQRMYRRALKSLGVQK